MWGHDKDREEIRLSSGMDEDFWCRLGASVQTDLVPVAEHGIHKFIEAGTAFRADGDCVARVDCVIPLFTGAILLRVVFNR